MVKKQQLTCFSSSCFSTDDVSKKQTIGAAMYFFELIKTCDKEAMIQDFLKKVSDSSKTNLVETHLRKALK